VHRLEHDATAGPERARAPAVPFFVSPNRAWVLDEDTRDITGIRVAPTRRMESISPELLAIARGEMEPEDPYGGLVPMFDSMVPRLLMRHDELIGLPDDVRHAFLLCQIDGRRTVAELADVCGLGEDETLDVLGDLVGLGAIEIL
jgi:hypothetical protein